MATRKKINSTTEAEVMFKADRKCCVCNGLGHHIHHIDSDNSNNKIDNLALLCFSCHDDASSIGNLGKKLSANAIKKYRNHQYAVIDTQRSSMLQTPTRTINKVNDTDLFNAALSAGVLLEIVKIEDSYFKASWNKKSEVLDELSKYHEFSTYRISVYVMEFLLKASNLTRSGMTNSVASNIHSLIICYFPPINGKDSKKKVYDLGKVVLNIGFNIAYDAFIKLDNYYLAAYGISIFKIAYQEANRTKNVKLTDEVYKKYEELESTLNRPERKDLISAIELVKIFKEDIDHGTLAYPIFPEPLYTKFISDSKK